MDMLPPAILAFALTCLLVELTPGPNMTYLALVALREGRRAGYAAVAGVALGLALVGLAAGLGAAELIAASPMIYQAMKWAGVAYFAWLTWESWTDAGAAAGEDPPPDGQLFRRGLVTNLLNPKAVIFYGAVLPAFFDPVQPVQHQALVLSAVYVLVATAVHAAIVTLAGALRPMLTDAGLMRMAGKVFAVPLAGVGIWIAVAT